MMKKKTFCSIDLKSKQSLPITRPSKSKISGIYPYDDKIIYTLSSSGIARLELVEEENNKGYRAYRKGAIDKLFLENELKEYEKIDVKLEDLTILPLANGFYITSDSKEQNNDKWVWLIQLYEDPFGVTKFHGEDADKEIKKYRLKNILEDLPKEIFGEISKYVDFQDIAQMFLLNRSSPKAFGIMLINY